MYKSLFLKVLFYLLFIFPNQTSNLNAQQLSFNKNCQQAYQYITSLQFEQGKKMLAQEKKQNPNNALIHLLENYIDFFTVFLNEQESDLRKMESRAQQRLAILSKTNDQSPYHLYTQAEIKLQMAFARLKFEEYFKAFWEVRKSYKWLTKNQKKFPNFYPNLKTLGILHALIGTVPDKYKWGIKILGLQGNIQQGMSELATFVKLSKKNNHTLHPEGQLLHSFLLVYLANNNKKAWQEAKQLPTQNHLLNSFLVADIAFRTGHTNEAIRIAENRPQTAEYFDFPFMNYFLGSLKINRLDEDAANHLKRFLRDFKGKHYIKDAHQKLAWTYLLKGDEIAYKNQMRLCLQTGHLLMDADKQAHKNAKDGVLPNPDLLKARLLFDGGYYQKALAVMQTKAQKDFRKPIHQLEFVYRYARIYEGLGKYTKALELYKKTITQSTKAPQASYFAPKSCLQMGKIYEGQNKKQEAISYYKKCMAYKNYEYKDSFDQQAKAGLNRLKN